MRKISLLAVLAVMCLTLVSCAEGGSGDHATYESGASALNGISAVDSYSSFESKSYDGESVQSESMNNNNSNNDTDNAQTVSEDDVTLSADKVVYHATVSIDTADFKGSDAALTKLIADYNMIVESRNYSTNSNSSKYEEISLRVPADKFQEALDKTGDIGKITSSNTYADNITQQYIDVESKVEAKEKRVERIKDFIAGTSDYNELRSLYGDLETAEYELDNLKSQLKNLKLDVAYSYLMIRINDTHRYTSTGRDVSEDSWFAARGYEVWDSLSAFRVFLTGIVTFLIYLFPYLIIAAIVAYFCVKHTKKKKTKKLAAKHAAENSKTEDTADNDVK